MKLEENPCFRYKKLVLLLLIWRVITTPFQVSWLETVK